MNSDQIRPLLATLQSGAAALVTAPDTETILSNLEGFRPLLTELQRSLETRGADDTPAGHRMKKSARETLTHLQGALIYAQSRLEHERKTIHSELIELAAQERWAQTSQQST